LHHKICPRFPALLDRAILGVYLGFARLVRRQVSHRIRVAFCVIRGAIEKITQLSGSYQQTEDETEHHAQ
jgi:hypothetical protein